MLTTTLNAIRKHSPCSYGWTKLLAGLGKTCADDDPLEFARILEINGLDDALWCCRAAPQYDPEWRLYAVWCARQVQHMMSDPRSLVALDVAERYARGEASDTELSAAGDAAVAAVDTAWAAARSAAWDAAWAAAWAAAGAATEVNALSVFDHITQAKLVAIWLPMVDAFDAGLWLYWITPIEVICVEQPCLHISENRLHREDGPAVYWPSGESYYFWRGVQVPGEWISDKKSLTASLALTWDNIEQRRCACEIIGWARILAELDATVIDHDDDPHVGDLVEVNLPDVGRERFLRVLCGTGREFAIPVPPSITTAIGGQAWTYGYDDPKSFRKPEVRT